MYQDTPVPYKYIPMIAKPRHLFTAISTFEFTIYILTIKLPTLCMAPISNDPECDIKGRLITFRCEFGDGVDER